MLDNVFCGPITHELMSSFASKSKHSETNNVFRYTTNQAAMDVKKSTYSEPQRRLPFYCKRAGIMWNLLPNDDHMWLTNHTFAHPTTLAGTYEDLDTFVRTKRHLINFIFATAHAIMSEDHDSSPLKDFPVGYYITFGRYIFICIDGKVQGSVVRSSQIVSKTDLGNFTLQDTYISNKKNLLSYNLLHGSQTDTVICEMSYSDFSNFVPPELSQPARDRYEAFISHPEPALPLPRVSTFFSDIRAPDTINSDVAVGADVLAPHVHRGIDPSLMDGEVDVVFDYESHASSASSVGALDDEKRRVAVSSASAIHGDLAGVGSNRATAFEQLAARMDFATGATYSFDESQDIYDEEDRYEDRLNMLTEYQDNDADNYSDDDE